MDIGKIKLQVPQTYSGIPDSALNDIYGAVSILSTELAVTAGFATLKASVAIARGQAVNIFNGQLRLASASGSIPAIGICVNAGGAGQPCRIMLGSGYASGLSGLTLNSYVYLGNSGALVFAKPNSGFTQGLGYTLSASEMFVLISAP